METRKTRFEQVPLEMILKMLAEQSRREELSQLELAASNDAGNTTTESNDDKSLEKPGTPRPLGGWTQ